MEEGGFWAKVPGAVKVAVAGVLVLAILFHPCGEPSTQNKAICLCSSVRVVLSMRPRLFTSLKSAAYFLLRRS